MQHSRPLLLLLLCYALPSPAYQPEAEPVAPGVYAIVGPLDQRSPDNDGLNANLGFVVTGSGVILIDSGASRLGAERIAAAIAAVSDRPVRWVVNTGSQDHRWLGNDFFAARGAETIALARTAATQGQQGARQLASLERFLGDRLQGTRPLPARRRLAGETGATLELGGETLELRYTDAHFPGDAWVWLPRHRILFSGDLVYVDRLLGVMPESSVHKGHAAFRALEALAPEHIVPGHGRVCDLARARKDTGDYYDFLVRTIGAAAREMEPMQEIIDRYSRLPAFEHLEHFDDLHRANMNRTYLEFEAL